MWLIKRKRRLTARAKAHDGTLDRMDDASTRHVIPEAPSSFNVCMYCSCSMDHDLDLDLAPAQIDKHGFFNRSRIPACVSASSSQKNPDQLSSAVTRNIQLTKLTRLSIYHHVHAYAYAFESGETLSRPPVEGAVRAVRQVPGRTEKPTLPVLRHHHATTIRWTWTERLACDRVFGFERACGRG